MHSLFMSQLFILQNIYLYIFPGMSLITGSEDQNSTRQGCLLSQTLFFLRRQTHLHKLEAFDVLFHHFWSFELELEKKEIEHFI